MAFPIDFPSFFFFKTNLQTIITTKKSNKEHIKHVQTPTTKTTQHK